MPGPEDEEGTFLLTRSFLQCLLLPPQHQDPALPCWTHSPGSTPAFPRVCASPHAFPSLHHKLADCACFNLTKLPCAPTGILVLSCLNPAGGRFSSRHVVERASEWEFVGMRKTHGHFPLMSVSMTFVGPWFMLTPGTCGGPLCTCPVRVLAACTAGIAGEPWFTARVPVGFPWAVRVQVVSQGECPAQDPKLAEPTCTLCGIKHVPCPGAQQCGLGTCWCCHDLGLRPSLSSAPGLEPTQMTFADSSAGLKNVQE